MEQAKLSNSLDEVYVATCDDEIKDYIESIGGKAFMTKDTHERCTDRTAEALEKIEAETGERVDLVVMIQGDEPMLVPESVDASIEPFKKDKTVKVVNLMTEIKTVEEHEDPNEVKVVVDNNSDAVYFSREPIPSRKKFSGDVKALKQVCIIPFQRDFLLEYLAMEPTYLEQVESVDMLRIMEHGHKVRMVPMELDTYAVDTVEDLKKVEQLLDSDPLCRKYLG